MRSKIFILISFGLLSILLSSGICPDRDTLWKRLVFLRDSSRLLPSEQLPELLLYEKDSKCALWNDSTYEFLLRRIGSIYFLSYDYLKASLYLRRAIDIIKIQEGSPFVNMKQLVTNYYWLSRCFDSLNMQKESLKALDSCSVIALKYKIIDKSSLWALYARVENSFNIGDYERCIHYAEICEMLSKEYAKTGGVQANIDGTKYASSSLEWNVNALLVQKKYEYAEKLLTNRIDEYNNTGLKEYLGIAYEQLAKINMHSGNYSGALKYFIKAIACEQKVGHYNRCRTLLGDIGFEVYFIHLNDPGKALYYFRKALIQNHKNESLTVLDSMESLNILNYMADVHVQLGNYDSAFYFFQLAFNQIQPGMNETGILSNQLLNSLFDIPRFTI